jgi:hypothetical protein
MIDLYVKLILGLRFKGTIFAALLGMIGYVFNSNYIEDQSVIFLGALRLSLGHLPFQDFFSPIGIFSFLLPAIGFKIYGPSHDVIRFLDTGIDIFSVFVFELLMIRLGVSIGIAAFGAITLYCLNGLPMNFVWYNTTAFMFSIIAFLFVSKTIDDASMAKRFFLMSLAWFFSWATFWTKQDYGAASVFGVWVLFIFSFCMHSKKLKMDLIISLASFLLMGFILYKINVFDVDSFNAHFASGKPYQESRTHNLTLYEIMLSSANKVWVLLLCVLGFFFYLLNDINTLKLSKFNLVRFLKFDKFYLLFLLISFYQTLGILVGQTSSRRSLSYFGYAFAIVFLSSVCTKIFKNFNVSTFSKILSFASLVSLIIGFNMIWKAIEEDGSTIGLLKNSYYSFPSSLKKYISNDFQTNIAEQNGLPSYGRFLHREKFIESLNDIKNLMSFLKQNNLFKNTECVFINTTWQSAMYVEVQQNPCKAQIPVWWDYDATFYSIDLANIENLVKTKNVKAVLFQEMVTDGYRLLSKDLYSFLMDKSDIVVHFLSEQGSYEVQTQPLYLALFNLNIDSPGSQISEADIKKQLKVGRIVEK